MNSARLISLALLPAAVLLFALPASAQSDKNCKIVERDASAQSSDGALSSSVTAGGGRVTAHTSGGNSVTMHSGDGSVSSSVSTTTGSGGRSQTVVTHSDGSCTIYRDKEK
jgi:hypothetical protein